MQIMLFDGLQRMPWRNEVGFKDIFVGLIKTYRTVFANFYQKIVVKML